MDPAIALLAFVTLQRFVEFIWDWRSTQRLRASGAVEFGGLHYPAMMLVHAGWLAGLWVLGYDSPVIPGFVIAFLLLQVARYWVLATLCRRWTTRVIVMPGTPLVESGPYRLMRHPTTRLSLSSWRWCRWPSGFPSTHWCRSSFTPVPR